MPKIYKVGVVFEFDPEGEHDFLFEGMTEEQIRKDMIRMATDDIYAGNGSVEIVSVEEYIE